MQVLKRKINRTKVDTEKEQIEIVQLKLMKSVKPLHKKCIERKKM